MNSDLSDLHDMLVARNSQLNASLDEITEAALAKAVVTGMREVLHRIDLVQSLLFAAATKKISAAVDRVKESNRDLTKALKSIDNATEMVKSVSGFLSVVDKAIDVAKVLV